MTTYMLLDYEEKDRILKDMKIFKEYNEIDCDGKSWELVGLHKGIPISLAWRSWEPLQYECRLFGELNQEILLAALQKQRFSFVKTAKQLQHEKDVHNFWWANH